MSGPLGSAGVIVNLDPALSSSLRTSVDSMLLDQFAAVSRVVDDQHAASRKRLDRGIAPARQAGLVMLAQIVDWHDMDRARRLARRGPCQLLSHRSPHARTAPW